MAKKRKRQGRIPPTGVVRQSQLLTTFGPGNMMDLIDSAVLVGGLDHWSWAKDHVPVPEPRLRDALADRLEKHGITLSRSDPFRAPPIGDDDDPGMHQGISVLEFPRWMVCQSPGCRALMSSGAMQPDSRGRYVHACGRKTTAEMVPVRFVATCSKGHLDDFPWVGFVHPPDHTCSSPKLRLWEGATGDFSEIIVECATCGERRKLKDALNIPSNFPCSGQRPWLGGQARETCDQRMRLLVRTASNAYFSQVVSAISIPEKGVKLYEIVNSLWSVLISATPDNLHHFRDIPNVRAGLEGFSDKEVLEVVKLIRENRPPPRKPLRTAEFEQLCAAEPERAGEIAPIDAKFFHRAIPVPAELSEWVEQIVLVSKLREVQAQVGFTRIEPIIPNLQGELEDRDLTLAIQPAPLGLQQDWLPAIELRGEGIFLQLREARLQQWLSLPALLERAHKLQDGHERQFGQQVPFPNARFIMLHSLAHLLMSAIALECGYAASSIRERIYCSPLEDPEPMAGILLSTGTSGSEGTLGGLVDQGRHMLAHFRRAFDLGSLCSNDPVCAWHDPSEDPAERYLEGAACHGCLFVAEVSCERFNRYLDRALVVPAMGHPEELAFIGRRP